MTIGAERVNYQPISMSGAPVTTFSVFKLYRDHRRLLDISQKALVSNVCFLLIYWDMISTNIGGIVGKQ